MTVCDLSRGQLIELKGCYLIELDDEGILEEITGLDKIYYSTLSDVDEIVSDDIIFKHYNGVEFSNDDFGCTATQFNYYDLVDYFDVWGNKEDGWEVNNLGRVKEKIMIAEDATNEDIINILNVVGFFANATTDEIEVDDLCDGFIELISKENGYPLGRLERRM